MNKAREFFKANIDQIISFCTASSIVLAKHGWMLTLEVGCECKLMFHKERGIRFSEEFELHSTTSGHVSDILVWDINYSGFYSFSGKKIMNEYIDTGDINSFLMRFGHMFIDHASRQRLISLNTLNDLAKVVNTLNPNLEIETCDM